MKHRRPLLFLVLITISIILSLLVMISISLFGQSAYQSINQYKFNFMSMRDHSVDQDDLSFEQSFDQRAPFASVIGMKPLISYDGILEHLYEQTESSLNRTINQSIERTDEQTSDQSIISQSTDTIIDPWLYRLQPMSIENEADFDWVNINLMMLTGHFNHDRLFKQLPCIQPYTIDPAYPVPTVVKSVTCTNETLLVDPSKPLLIATFIRPDGSILIENRWLGGLQSHTINPISQSTNQSMSESLQQSIHVIQHSMFNHSTSEGLFMPTYQSTFQSIQSMNQKFMIRSRVPHLSSNHPAYWYEVVIGNGTHCTQAIQSIKQSINHKIKNKQLFLFKREQSRITEYFNQLISHPSTKQSVNQPISQSNKQTINRSPFQPAHDFPLSVKPSSNRQLAPFEAAYDQCNLSVHPLTGQPIEQSFNQMIEQYRKWHDQQVERLMAVKDDVYALAKLFEGSSKQSTDQSFNPFTAYQSVDYSAPIRIINAGVYRWSGVTDRMNGWTGIYLIALLTNRVLLFDDDWPDLQRIMLSSLRLNRATVVPLLKHDTLKLYTQDVPVSDAGPIVDHFNQFYTKPIIQITSFKGIVMRILTESSYSHFLLDLGLTPENVLGCLFHSLWIMRLSSLRHSPDYEPVLKELLHHDALGIGIQIRSWHDAVFFEVAKQQKAGNYSVERSLRNLEISQQIATLKKSGTYGFFRCARDISDTVRLMDEYQTKQTKWFLMSDDDSIRAAAMQRWGKYRAFSQSINQSISQSIHQQRIHQTIKQTTEPYLLSLIEPGGVGHSNAVDLDVGLLFTRHALVEQFMYSLCHYHVISISSGFGRIPALQSFRHKKIFAIAQQNITQKTGQSCMDEDVDGTDFIELSKQWSKV